MTETISNTKKSLNVLNKLIQNGHYNGFIESGKFELTVFNSNDPNEIIRITEGRFDINLNTVNN